MWTKMLILAGVLATAEIGAAQAEGLAYATSATVLRADPSANAHIVTKVPVNAELEVGHCRDGWCFAHLGSSSGYVASNKLDFEETGGTVVERTYVYPDYYPGPYVYGPAFYCCGGGYWHGGPRYWRR